VGEISAAEDENLMLGRKWLKMKERKIYQGMTARIAGICMGSEYDPVWLVRWARGKIFLVRILQTAQSRGKSKKMDMA
jgi:hypothetical protein